MKVRYIGESDPLGLINGKVYEVLEVDGDYYRIVDETDEDYLYEADSFETVDEEAVS